MYSVPETGKYIEIYLLKQAPVLGKQVLIIPKVLASYRLDCIIIYGSMINTYILGPEVTLGCIFEGIRNIKVCWTLTYVKEVHIYINRDDTSENKHIPYLYGYKMGFSSL